MSILSMFIPLTLLSSHTSALYINDPATTEIYPLSLHDALPISDTPGGARMTAQTAASATIASIRGDESRECSRLSRSPRSARSEEHTSELQSLTNLVCRLLLEKKKYTDSAI